MPNGINRQEEYPTWVGLIFIFNLIVGTGALTLPLVFAKAGWALGSILIVILAFVSYMTVTFVIESIACANAIMHWRRLQFLKRDRALPEDIDEDATGNVRDSGRSSLIDENLTDLNIEQTPLFSQRSSYYVLDNKIEMGEMAGLFLNEFGRIIFYICLIIYLYGDLSIYSAAVAKSLSDVICISNNSSANHSNQLPCFTDHSITRLDIYRLSLIAFGMLLGPFAFFNVQKTKYIQLLTGIFRWLSFTIMISLAIARIVKYGALGKPPAFNISGLPSLFGACVYSFMCHHSLPSIIAPINNKKRIKTLMSYDYSLICLFYLFLALTGAFAFAHLEELYTLNFEPTSSGNDTLSMKLIEYFLALFPVLTLSASFPIISITLRNNLQSLFLDNSSIDSYNFFQRRIMFPLLALLPPLVVTYFTESVTTLVRFTGIAGTGIQYLIPIALVYSARKICTDLLGQGIINEYRSPFRSTKWLLFVLIWSIGCIILVITKLIY